MRLPTRFSFLSSLRCWTSHPQSSIIPSHYRGIFVRSTVSLKPHPNMDHAQHSAIVNFIWGIADDVLRDVYVRGKYRDVILPMTVSRRLDCLLEQTQDAVLTMKLRLDKAKIGNQHAPLCQAAGQAFYNTSAFTLKRLLDSPKQLKANFGAYLDGFSPNVQEILDKFKFRNQLPTLV